MSASNAAAGVTTESQPLDEHLFAIAGNNTWVHIYPDVQTMLACKDTVNASPGSLEFFNVAGQRLAPVVNAAWALEGLQVTADQPDEPMVRARLCAVIDSVRTTLAQRLAQEPNPPGTLEVALARLPDLTGRGLVECYTLLESNFGDGPGMNRDDGSFWHNFWCH